MTAWLEILLIGCGVLLLFPVSVLFAEILSALLIRQTPEREDPGKRQRIAVLIPAHNEALMIADTLQELFPQLEASDRLIVIADNCVDETAAIAGREGAEVIERSDLTRRGKGYALDFGVRHLEYDPPDIVVIVDADCRVSFGAIDKLARACSVSGRPTQALYLMEAPESAGPKTRIAQFAWTVKNHVRPLGLLRLGLPCQLMGTGMAFPWACLSTANLASSHIVEDLKLGIDMALAGTPPRFCTAALVTSSFPSSITGIGTQRERWEHGHLSIIFSEVPRLLLRSLLRLDRDCLILALDLCVPPLALLALMLAALGTTSSLFYLFAGAPAPLILAFIAVGVFAVALLLSWRRFGRNVVPLRTLILAGLYACGKIPIYLRFLVARQVEWVRSKRDGDQSL